MYKTTVIIIKVINMNRPKFSSLEKDSLEAFVEDKRPRKREDVLLFEIIQRQLQNRRLITVINGNATKPETTLRNEILLFYFKFILKNGD